MKVKRQDVSLGQPITEESITLLERELENRKAWKAAQDTEVERIRAHHAQLQAEEAERLEAERLEAERRQAIIDLAEAQIVPTGAVMSFGLSAGIDLKPLVAGYGLVVVAEGRIQLPVITCLGHCTTVDSGPVLSIHRHESQLVLKSAAPMYQALYQEQVRQETIKAIAAETAREPAGSIIYLSCIPSAEIVPDLDNPKLVRIKAKWPSAFAYKTPTIEGETE